MQEKMPPLCKGRWQKSLIFDGGIVFVHHPSMLRIATFFQKKAFKFP